MWQQKGSSTQTHPITAALQVTGLDRWDLQFFSKGGYSLVVLLSLEQQYHGGQISRHLGPKVNNSLCKPSAVGSVYKCGSSWGPPIAS